jgi:nicotinamidase-related amidase
MSEGKAPLRSRAEDAALVVIDMQEKLVPAMYGMHELIYRTEMLLRGCTLLGMPVFFTQQYTKGLGQTIDAIQQAYLDSVAETNENVKRASEDQIAPQEQADFSYIEKTAFSVMDEPALAAALEATARREILLCGIEAHVCVMQSALDMADLGYTVRVAADAAASRHASDADRAYARMERAGITITSVESLLFDLMKDSRHPLFRRISALVR